MIVLTLGKYLFTLFCAFLVTFLLTPLVEKVAPRLSLLDMPEARRLHQQPTPTGGGIAVFAGFHLGCAAIFLLPWPFFEGHLEFGWWWRFLIVSSVLLAVGLADDVRNLRPLVKLLGQIAVAVLAFLLDMRVGRLLHLELHYAVDLFVTVGWFLALINAFNLIDGMDGLATGLAAIASLGLASSYLFRHEPRDTMVMLALLGACLAFLRYNFYPARIFLGDAGSMFLGLVLAAVPLATNAKGTLIASMGVPLLAVGVPVFDTMLAVWRRSVRRAMARAEHPGQSGPEGRLMQADMDHLHHRLAREGLSQRSVATWLYGLNAALVVLGILLMLYHSHSLGILLVAFVAAVYVIVKHLAHVEL
jgi:UDP-GlcNAc:undecaprenyl-phosphate/decaprenyl-phosphate GlcNAc-1-phosphate transferase